MSLPAIQQYVTVMCESIEQMKITEKQKDFARAVMRAAIEYANEAHGMSSSLSRPKCGSDEEMS